MPRPDKPINPIASPSTGTDAQTNARRVVKGRWMAYERPEGVEIAVDDVTVIVADDADQPEHVPEGVSDARESGAFDDVWKVERDVNGTQYLRSDVRVAQQATSQESS